MGSITVYQLHIIMSVSKTNKLFRFVNWIICVTIRDGRQFIGQLIAFDKHTNVVLKDTVEFRQEDLDPSVAWTKRELGLILLRGQNVTRIQPESPPQIKNKSKDIVIPGVSNSMCVNQSLKNVISTTSAHSTFNSQKMQNISTHNRY